MFRMCDRRANRARRAPAGALYSAAAGVAIAAALPALAFGQELPRTPWGHPDLQGIWSNTTTTPLQRPEDLTGRTTLTAEERAERDAERARNADRPPPPGQTGAYNSFWFERGFTGEQTSLVVDPPSGPAAAADAAGRGACGTPSTRCATATSATGPPTSISTTAA